MFESFFYLTLLQMIVFLCLYYYFFHLLPVFTLCFPIQILQRHGQNYGRFLNFLLVYQTSQPVKTKPNAHAAYRHVTTLTSPPPELTCLLIGQAVVNQHKAGTKKSDNSTACFVVEAMQIMLC